MLKIPFSSEERMKRAKKTKGSRSSILPHWGNELWSQHYLIVMYSPSIPHRMSEHLEMVVQCIFKLWKISKLNWIQYQIPTYTLIHKHENVHTPHFNIILTCRRCLNSLGKWNRSGEPITNFGVCSCSENTQVRWNLLSVKFKKKGINIKAWKIFLGYRRVDIISLYRSW